MTEGSGERGAESRGKGVAAPARQNTTLRRTLAPTASRAHRRGRRERTQHTHTHETHYTQHRRWALRVRAVSRPAFMGGGGGRRGRCSLSTAGHVVLRCVPLFRSHWVMGPPRPTRADISAPLAAPLSLSLSFSLSCALCYAAFPMRGRQAGSLSLEVNNATHPSNTRG